MDIDIVLQERLNDGISVYLDDIIVSGKTEMEHDKAARWVL